LSSYEAIHLYVIDTRIFMLVLVRVVLRRISFVAFVLLQKVQKDPSKLSKMIHLLAPIDLPYNLANYAYSPINIYWQYKYLIIECYRYNLNLNPYQAYQGIAYQAYQVYELKYSTILTLYITLT
jgi:hypothetical protein